MGLEEYPEIKLAQRIFAKHSLKIPFDIEKLIKNYAKLVYKSIPIPGVDGVSLNLKVIGKTPTVIVNSDIPKTRQLFTLAHELGHLIIPWHLGTIVDEIYSQSVKDLYYKDLEQEANRFAAELLMPTEWVLNEYNNVEKELAKLHTYITKNGGVSDQAAAYKMREVLPPNIVFTAEENGTVTFSGITTKTTAIPQKNGDVFNKDYYPYVEKYSDVFFGQIHYHWWKLRDQISIEATDSRSWRDILDEITQDINPIQGGEKFKKSINGIIACANGNAKREKNYCIETVVAASIYRFVRGELKDFVAHPDFEKFVKIRVLDFFTTK